MMNQRQIKTFLVITAIALVLSVILVSNTPGHAAPVLQFTPFPTPTPGPDGRIIYKVKAGDTLLRISLISGVPVEQLRGLNNLVGDDIIVGQELLLGLGGPVQASPTPGPSPTPTPVLPTPSPQPGSGTLCVLLYNDENGDAIRQEDEFSIAGGALSINNPSGSISLTAESKRGGEAQCFEDLPEGRYTISVAIPEGYNPTTVTNVAIDLYAGDSTYVDLGAQVNSNTIIDQPIQNNPERRSPLLGIVGGILLISGIVLAFFAGRLLRGK